MSRINCLASSHGSSADLHGDMRERNRGAACQPFNCNNHFDLFSPPGSQQFNSYRIHKNNGRNFAGKHAHASTRSRRTEAQSLLVYPSDSPLSRISFDFILANETVQGERQVNNQSL